MYIQFTITLSKKDLLQNKKTKTHLLLFNGFYFSVVLYLVCIILYNKYKYFYPVCYLHKL